MSQRRDPAEAHSRLFSTAESQGGYFTAGQALSAGYGYRLQNFHVKRGNWLRVARNLYRLRAYPIAQREDLIRWSFWSLGRGVVSHESALEFHQVGDVIPDHIHLTVPTGFRKRDERAVLHRGVLGPGDFETYPGFRVTTPLRTIVDVADSDLAAEHFEEAVRQALTGGHVREKKLVGAAATLGSRARRRLLAALERTSAA